MALTQTYYYCNELGGTNSVLVTLTVGSEQSYFSGTEGDCYVIKKRRKITASIASAVSEDLQIRYGYTYTSVRDYDPESLVTYDMVGHMTLDAGDTSVYEYVDTYIRATCDTYRENPV